MWNRCGWYFHILNTFSKKRQASGLALHCLLPCTAARTAGVTTGQASRLLTPAFLKATARRAHWITSRHHTTTGEEKLREEIDNQREGLLITQPWRVVRGMERDQQWAMTPTSSILALRPQVRAPVRSTTSCWRCREGWGPWIQGSLKRCHRCVSPV